MNKIFKYSPGIISIICLVCFFYAHGFFGKKNPELIRSDGIGYYSYLPSLFIYHDLSGQYLHAVHEKNYKDNGLPTFILYQDDHLINKYYVGTALLMLPFFLIAQGLSHLLGYSTDGFANLYQYLIGLGALFYLWMGCRFIKRLLELYNASLYEIMLILVLLVFGTNLFHYAIYESSMSHIYSFVAISGFLFYLKDFFISKQRNSFLWACFFLGLVVLIRPINILIVLAVPFLSGDTQQLRNSFLELTRKYNFLIAGIIVFLFLLSLQLYIWKMESGHWFVWSYQGERFYFNRPEMINVLFSYRKGIFIWTPLAFLACISFLYLSRKNAFEFMTLVGFFVILIYVLSCWHQWYYGGSFGFRPLVDYLSLVALMLLFALRYFNKRIIKAGFIFLCLMTILINQVQAYQYRYGIILSSEMNCESYWQLFMKTSLKWQGYAEERRKDYEADAHIMAVYKTDFERSSKEWFSPNMEMVGLFAHSGSYVSEVSSSKSFSATFLLGHDSLLYTIKYPVVNVSFYSKPIFIERDNWPKLNVSIKDSTGNFYFYHDIPFKNNQSVENDWVYNEYSIRTERLRSINDTLKVYVWSTGKNKLWIDDMEIKLMYEYK